MAAAAGPRRIFSAITLSAALALGAKLDAEAQPPGGGLGAHAPGGHGDWRRAVALDPLGAWEDGPQLEAKIVRRQPSAASHGQVGASLSAQMLTIHAHAGGAANVTISAATPPANSLAQAGAKSNGSNSTAKSGTKSHVANSTAKARVNLTVGVGAKSNSTSRVRTSWRDAMIFPAPVDVITIDPDALSNLTEALGGSETTPRSLPVASAGNGTVLNASNVPLNAVPLVPKSVKSQPANASSQSSVSSNSSVADPVVANAIRAAAKEAEREAAQNQTNKNNVSNSTSDDDEFNFAAFRDALQVGFCVMLSVWCCVGCVVSAIACCCQRGKPQKAAAAAPAAAAQPLS